MVRRALGSILYCTLVAAVIAPTFGCGPSSEDVAAMRAAEQAHQPYKARFDKIIAALPAPGAEREVPCATPIPAEGLAAMNVAHLEWFLGLTPVGQGESWDQNRFDMGIGHDLRAGFVPQPDAEPSRGAIMNLENAAKELSTIRHVVIFRPTSIDKGEVAGRGADGAFEIKRPAVWKGWVFAFAFEDEPSLVAAFPIEATSRDQMTVVTRTGAPDTEVLIDDVALQLRDPTLARLGKPGCPA